MTKKNEIPVYTESAKELKAEINARIAEVMHENVADSSYRVAPIKPIGINGIEYDNIAISKDDRGVPYMYLSSHANYDVNLQRIDKLPDSTSLLKEILQKVNDSYYSLNGAAVKAKPDLHKFLEGEYVQFKTKSGKETDHDIRGRVNKVGNVWNMSHIFGSPAVEIKGENFFIDDIKEDSLMVQSHINAVPSNQLDIDKTNKELSSFAIKDFDIKCDVGVGNGNGEYYNIDTIHVRNRQLDSVSGSYHGYEYNEREVAVPVEGVYSNNITSFMNFINENNKKAIMFAVASKLPYMRIWADEVAKQQHDQEKADRVTARMGRLVALMPDPGDKMTFKKPMALDDYISIDGIGDMEITEIKNAGDGRFTVSDGERVIPFGRMMEWDQESVVTMCEQLDRENTAKMNLAAGSKEAGSPVKSLIMDIAAYEVSHLSLDSKKGVSWDDIKETLDDDTLMMIDDLDKHVQETVARVSLTKELDAMRATNGNSIKVPLTYVGLGMESGVTFSEIRYIEDERDYVGIDKDHEIWFSMKSIPDAAQVANVHNKVLLPQLAQMINQGDTVKLQTPVTIHMEYGDVEIDRIRMDYKDDAGEAEISALGRYERDGKTYADELDISDMTYSMQPEDLKNIIEAVRTMKESRQQEAGKDNSQAYAALQEKAVSLFGKDAHLELADYKSVTRVGVGDMPDTIIIDTIDIEDGKMTLSSDDIGGEIDEKMLDSVYIENISAMLDELHTAYQQPMEKHTGMPDTEEKHLVREAIVSRILDPSPSATFTKEQQDVIISYLKDYPSVDRKLQALSPLWQEAEKDARVKGEPSEWFTPVKEELNDLASGIRREPSEGLKLK